MASVGNDELGRHRLNPRWINLDDIRLWLHTCDTRHQCRAVHSRTEAAWLIDVYKQCLVPCNPDVGYQYVALSYVWGQCPSSMTNIATLDAFQLPNAFSEESKNVTIPKTIRHAMKFVGLLNIQYLWVDRFCICQDDERSMHQQLRYMGHIYEQAYLTLIAANGDDADHGLYGIAGVTRPRQFLNFENTWLYARNLKHWKSNWYTRGWTFQELFFSRRKLKFQHEVVLWECECATWHESTGITGKIPSEVRGFEATMVPPIISISPWGCSRTNLTSIGGYLGMVSDYNDRKLTNEEDVMRAFAGVVTKLEPDFAGGFIWGLPVANFEVALLWQNDGITTQRHVDSIQLPSWSWVGWHGRIEKSPWDLKRLVYGSNTRFLQSEDNMYRDLDDDTKTGQRRVIPSCEWNYTTRDGIFPIVSDFRLASRPELAQTRRKLQDASQRGDTHSFLRTRTKVVKCSSMVLEREVSRAVPRLALLYDTSGGVTIKKRRFMGYFSSSIYDRWRTRDPREFELMLLSKSVTPKPPHRDWDPLFFRGDTPSQHGYDEYHAYNVLLITRRDGIAYREAVGVVSVEVFDSLEGEMMDITLG